MAHKVGADALEKLMRQPAHIRNICILAHVDHGKTTLSDCLISSNAIISQKLAGRVRYMDSTEEEQARGITMKSSAIALLHTDEAFRELKQASTSPITTSTSAATASTKVPYLINLIDSPGHVDFSMDVATAARLCDGALVVVDSIEGVCIQTHAVLKVAWAEGVRPTLVINKVDRLITEVKMSPLEAYHHIGKILEQANVIMSELYTADLMATLNATHASTKDVAVTGTAGDGSKGGSSRGADADGAEKDGGRPYQFDAWGIDIDEAAESQLFFDPGRGNVVFASAFDGWAFSVDDFAALHADRMELQRATLRRCLWGDYYYNPKTKKIVTGEAAAAAAKGKPLAVSLMLERLWAVYDAAVENPDEARLTKIVNILGLTVHQRDLTAKDGQVKLQAIMRAWLPLHAAVLGMVVRKLPSPIEAQMKRLDKLWPVSKSLAATDALALPELGESMSPAERLQRVRKAVELCSPDDSADCVVFISKMFAVPKVSIPAADPLAETASLSSSAWWGVRDAANHSIPAERFDLRPVNVKHAKPGSAISTEDLSDVETFVAFARVFSGVLRPDRPVFVLGPRYDPYDPLANGCDHISLVEPPLPLYLLMGRELTRISAAFAGNVIGIGRLGSHILKTATLCSTPVCVSLAPMTFQTTPLVKVAVEPKDPRDLAAVEHGLSLLNQADPCVELSTTDAGEMQLSALGELHLDRCIKDLITRFAKVQVKVSPPIMNFMETIISSPPPKPALAITSPTEDAPPTLTSPTGPAGSIANIAAYPKTCMIPSSGVIFHVPSATTYAYTADRSVMLRVKAVPAPQSLAAFVMDHAVPIRAMLREAKNMDRASMSADVESTFNHFRQLWIDAGPTWAAVFDSVICLGPKGVGPNFFIDQTTGILDADGNKISAQRMRSVWQVSGLAAESEASGSNAGVWLHALRSGIIQGFQLATAAGPLCAEPMWGVALILEEVRLLNALPTSDAGEDVYPQLPSGQLITIARDACRISFQAGVPRLVEAYFKCELQCSGGRGGGTSGEQLGKLYAVLNRRRARILSEDMFEGTQTFLITSLLPVVESFGFADDLRKQTSGAATSPQLVFDHWEVMEQDPFFQPTTAEEKEEFGDTVYEGQLKNIARRFMDAVRERKGMPTEKQLVLHAEKQSNLSRKK